MNSLTEQLHDLLNGGKRLGPEVTITITILLLVVASIIYRKKEQHRYFAPISIAGLLFAGLAIFIDWKSPSSSISESYFGNMLVYDQAGAYMQALVILGTLITVFLTLYYRAEAFHKTAEYHILLMGMVLGSLFAVRTAHWAMAVLALELISVCAYALTGFSNKRNGSEAAIKYLLFGATTTGLSLFGISLLYGISGSLDFSDMISSETLKAIEPPVFYVATFLAVAGILFKLASFPFHPWAGDVYEGAPTPLVSFFSTVPKIAGIAILLRFIETLSGVEFQNPEIIQGSKILLGAIAAVTITGGNLLALSQRDVKRMMAFSSVSQGGLFIATALCVTPSGFQALMFYLAVYLFMNTAAFMIIQIRENDGHGTSFRAFNGEGLKKPTYGIATVLVMASLIGLPLTAGFTGKIRIFTAMWEAFATQQSTILLVIFITAVLNTVIALSFYLRLPYVMYFRSSDLTTKKLGKGEYALLVTLSAPVLFLFFDPEIVTSFIESIPAFFK
ncbi:NADH-quinone oxidoreductase subunit N [Fulvitalea axinellae]|uniref:NADH-quinone oxidoreductase subunit N n=1 Tax=Fulvitalea axinellae TaxID=1182444 RepID=A0AAU9CP90_9BACT|nr:NADH-quinone oxidoreductase subunit N [Fulvitalea axinellae]